ncbi:hypothetical protein Tco_1071364, partial [Tanacetum coccineum]
RDIIYLEGLLINDTILNLPPAVFLDHDPRNLKNEPDNDLKSMVKIFDPEIHEKIISPTYVRLPDVQRIENKAKTVAGTRYCSSEVAVRGGREEDENAEDVQMADHLRPMEELLRIPILCIEDAIVVPAVLADQFELKPELLDFISNNPFFGLENDDPHSHIKRFYQITQTFKINQVPHDVVKLILFPFSLKGAAETWLENEPPYSITT